MCEKYSIDRRGQVYVATNKITGRVYRRFVSLVGRWYEHNLPGDHPALIDTLENAVCEFIEPTTLVSPVTNRIRPSTRALRAPRRAKARGEGNRHV